MTLAELYIKWSVILMDLLGPNIFSTLWMKGQVLHCERARLKVPDWSLVWNELLSKKLPIITSNSGLNTPNTPALSKRALFKKRCCSCGYAKRLKLKYKQRKERYKVNQNATESWTKATLTFVGSWEKTALEQRRTVTWNLAAVGRKLIAWKRQAKKLTSKG